MRIFICNEDERGFAFRLQKYLTELGHTVDTNTKKYRRSENSKYASEELRTADVIIGVLVPEVGLSHPYWEWADLNNRPFLFVKATKVEYISHRFISVYLFDCIEDIDSGFAALAEHLKRPINAPMEIQAFTYRHPLTPDSL